MDDILSLVMQRLILLPGIVIGLSFHEFGHAFVSSRLGDPTPKNQGRVTLNPAAHVDVIGFLALMLMGFGWGKPVQIDPRYYKHRRSGELLVSLAGVVMNLLLAVVGMVLMRIYYVTVLSSAFVYSASAAASVAGIVWEILNGLVQINLVLMFFNLIPLPPLDGFGIVTQLFKLDKYPWYWKFYQLGPMFLLLLIIFHGTQYIISPEVNWTYSFLMNLFFGGLGL